MSDNIKKAESILIKKLKVKSIDPNQELHELGLDSLDVVEILLDFEDTFGIRFSSDELKLLKKVSDLYNAVEIKLKK